MMGAWLTAIATTQVAPETLVRVTDSGGRCRRVVPELPEFPMI